MQPTTTQDYILSNVRDKTKYRRSFGVTNAATVFLEIAFPILDEAGGRPVCIVALEPGCLSVFKDELLKMFPDEPRARRISRSIYPLGDFLLAHDYQPPPVDIDVLVHTLCHQKSLFGNRGDAAILERTGARAIWLDSGCCAMAGSFGFKSRPCRVVTQCRRVGPAARGSQTIHNHGDPDKWL